MNMQKIIIAAMICLLVYSCKEKEEVTPTEPKVTTPKISKMSLLNNEWVLKETFVDDVASTTSGTGKYRFQKNGKMLFFDQGAWMEIGTYKFNDKDSNSLSVLFMGGGSSADYWWMIKKLDEKSFNTEFSAGGKKLNYNYTR